MIGTLLITMLVEAGVVTAYCLGRRKPPGTLLLTSLCGNLVTQTLLWVLLNLLFSGYLLVLLAAEVFIWILESLLLYVVPANRLRFREAVLLGLVMNLASFMLGWILPI